ncbi:hypothetical protein AB0K09_10335, partial [Streptomyces sp. NPDC049577]
RLAGALVAAGGGAARQPRGDRAPARRGLVPGSAEAADAVRELSTACDLLDREDAPDVQRCAALLDLARALRRTAAPAGRTLAVLARAHELATDDLQRLHCLTEQARVHAGVPSWTDSDDAYAAAVSLTEPHGTRRCELLLEWGRSLLERAVAPPPAPGAGPGRPGSGAAAAARRAEAVLREAFAVSPGRSPLRGEAQLLLGRALVARFRLLGFLPDLYESCHLLEQAARRAGDGDVRAEAWLALGFARLALAEQSAAVPLADAAAAFAAAGEEARARTRPGQGSLVAARAAHGYGTALERMGLRKAALAAYRDALQAWHELSDHLAEAPWEEVRATRESLARLADA